MRVRFSLAAQIGRVIKLALDLVLKTSGTFGYGDRYLTFPQTMSFGLMAGHAVLVRAVEVRVLQGQQSSFEVGEFYYKKIIHLLRVLEEPGVLAYLGRKRSQVQILHTRQKDGFCKR